MLNILKHNLMTATPKANTPICFYCDCKFNCALWFWDKWNVNLPLCSCTDVRLIDTKNVFEVNMQLLDEWGRENPKPYVKNITQSKKYYGIVR